MHSDEMSDAAGSYDAEVVTLTIDGVAVTKGAGAPGVFVEIGPNRTRFALTTGADGSATRSKRINLRRDLAVVLHRDSPGNEMLRQVRRSGHLAVIRIARAGDEFFTAQIMTVGADAPRDVGRGEVRWDLVVVVSPNG